MNQCVLQNFRDKEELPSVLDYEAKVVLGSKVKCSLHVANRARIDSGNGNATLFTRNPQRCIKITGTYGPISKDESLEIGRLHRPRLLRAPPSVKCVGCDVSAVP